MTNKPIVRTKKVTFPDKSKWIRVKDRNSGFNLRLNDGAHGEYHEIDIALPIMEDVISVEIECFGVSDIHESTGLNVSHNESIVSIGSDKFIKRAGEKRSIVLSLCGDAIEVNENASLHINNSSNKFVIYLALFSIFIISAFVFLWIYFSNLPSIPKFPALTYVAILIATYFGIGKERIGNFFSSLVQKVVETKALRLIIILAGIFPFYYCAILSINVSSNFLRDRALNSFYDWAMLRNNEPEELNRFKKYFRKNRERPEVWSVLATRHGLEYQKNRSVSGSTVASILGLEDVDELTRKYDENKLKLAFNTLTDNCKSRKISLLLKAFPSLDGSPMPGRDNGCKYSYEAFGNIADGITGGDKQLFYILYDEMLKGVYSDHKLLIEENKKITNIYRNAIDDANSPKNILDSTKLISALRGGEVSYSERRTFLTIASNAAVKGCVESAHREKYHSALMQIIGIMIYGTLDYTDADAQLTYAGTRRLLPIAWYFGENLDETWMARYTECLGTRKQFLINLYEHPENRILGVDGLDGLKDEMYFYEKISLERSEMSRVEWSNAFARLGNGFKGY